MSEDNINDEFLNAIAKFGDCPEKLFKMAKTPFQKMVAIEFFLIHKRYDLLEHKFQYIEKLIFAVISIGAISIGVQIFRMFLGVV